MKQDRVRRDRNRQYINHMKSMIKLILDYISKSEFDKAKKILPDVASAIDNAAKKNLIHKNNAARKKSRIEKALSKVSAKPKSEKKTK